MSGHFQHWMQMVQVSKTHLPRGIPTPRKFCHYLLVILNSYHTLHTSHGIPALMEYLSMSTFSRACKTYFNVEHETANFCVKSFNCWLHNMECYIFVVVVPKIRSRKNVFLWFSDVEYYYQIYLMKSKNIIFYDKNVKLSKIILLVMFFVIEIFITIASYQFFKK